MSTMDQKSHGGHAGGGDGGSGTKGVIRKGDLAYFQEAVRRFDEAMALLGPPSPYSTPSSSPSSTPPASPTPHHANNGPPGTIPSRRDQPIPPSTLTTGTTFKACDPRLLAALESDVEAKVSKEEGDAKSDQKPSERGQPFGATKVC